MQLFDDYIAPLTSWLLIHPHWALFITFIISFSESLAIIGSIVPGSVTMTAIGILAGSGVMRIDLTIIAAILGAIAGDGVSYLLGYYYRDSIGKVWPFKRYPHWLTYGEEYFRKHGGKSVLIGRFIGPLRSIIPVIAGMLGMPQWRFFIANVISAIGWSILYVTPGILIGAATTELSAEEATRLCLIILLALAGIWIASLILKWLIIKISIIIQVNLQYFLKWLNKHPLFSRFFHYLTPPFETNNYPTAVLVVLLGIATLFLILLLILTKLQTGFALFNTPLHLLLQSIRLPLFDQLFIFFLQPISTITIFGLILTAFCFFIYNKNYRGILYLTSLLLGNVLAIILINFFIHSPWPNLDLVYNFSNSSCPAVNLMMATSLFTFISAYLHQKNPSLASTLSKYVFTIILILGGLGHLYLGDHWLTDVLISWTAGFALGLLYWILYRKNSNIRLRKPLDLTYLFILLALLTTIATAFNFKNSYIRHLPSTHTYLMTEPVWWDQEKPLLPLYRNNRLGKKVNLMNIQYAGSIHRLQSNLQLKGWENYSESLFTKLLKRTNGKPEDKIMPLFPQLYENKHPELVMTWEHENPDFFLILRLWQSGYYLSHNREPIWIGSLQMVLQSDEKSLQMNKQDPIIWLVPSLQGFEFRRVNIPIKALQPLRISTEPDLLLIKE